MFDTIINRNRYAFFEGFEDWRDAVRSACALLTQDGTVPMQYADEVIKNIEHYGPYIVLIPGVALPHAMVDGVRESAVAFLKTEKPVFFEKGNPDKQATIFLAIAAKDAEKHLENIQQISSILEDDEIMKLLNEAVSAADLQNVQKILDNRIRYTDFPCANETTNDCY